MLNQKICIYTIVLEILFLCTTKVFAQKKPIDASGVIYENGYLYVVGNKSNHEIFKYEVTKTILKEGSDSGPEVKLLDILDIKNSEATDLEGIALLNGQPIVLSEDSRKLFTEKNTIADYSNIKEVKERGYRGLEGLTIKKIDKNTSMVALLWEGGWLSERKDPTILIQRLDHRTHNIFKGTKETVEMYPLYQDAMYELFEMADSIQDERLALRAPELLWNGSGFIALVVADHEDHFEKKWLCKIDSIGSGYGITKSCDLWVDDKLGDKVRLNWEGMTWVDGEQRKILLVADDESNLTMHVVEIPEDW